MIAPERNERLPVGVCMWGMTYTLGVQGTGTPRRHPAPLGPEAFLDLAASLGLGRAELSAEYVAPDLDAGKLAVFRSRAHDLGLAVTLSGPGLDVEGAPAALRRAFDAAEALGARHIRTTLSKILCGERKLLGGLGGWRAHLRRVADVLREIAPDAERRGLALAIENHQDATSWDLMELCEASGSAAVGVNLDTGNPLAVGEDILSFARRILPRLVNVHLKDYRMFATGSGYRLVRCALGEGLVPFRELFELFRERPAATLSIELAALDNRHIRFLDDDWWEGLGPRDIRDVLPVVRLWRERAETGEYRTPWERGRDAELPGYEMDQMMRSVRYIRELLSPVPVR